MSSSRTVEPARADLQLRRAGGFLEALEQLPDPRRRRGVRHRVAGIVAVALTAVLAGARSYPRLARRGLQMVLRLLAFNAEAWLAEHLNTYLADPDEYRAITRHLLHQGGHVDHTSNSITVTLDQPDTPRIARALHLLTEELNNTPAHMPGDPRPITYQVRPASISTISPALLPEI